MERTMDPLQKQMLDDVFDAFTMLSSNGYVSLMHVDGGFTRYSKSAVDLLGLPGEYVPNGAMDWNDYLHPDDRKRYMDAMGLLTEGKTQTYDITYRVRTVADGYHIFRAVGAVLRGSDGKPSLIGGALIDQGIAENTDPITALPNKGVYMGRLARFIAQGASTYSLMVGLNGFSDINMVHGYTYGNRVLQETAWVIQEVVAQRAEVFRLDGSTFGILSDALTREEMAAIYDMVSYRLQRGIEISGNRNIIIANGGMISASGADVDPETIYSCLNYAHDESKKNGRGELVDFNGSINFEGARSLELIGAVRASAQNGCAGFSMEYLPVINAGTDVPNGAEAVICWEGDPYGKVRAEDFVPVLEHDFLFEEVTDFMLEQALTDGVRFLEAAPEFLLCLNVHRMQVESDYFIENLDHYLEQTGFPRQQLSLKFDAACRFCDMGLVNEIVGELHKRGIITIIDGFGSGSNSIVFLKNVPFDAVSIDSQFIAGADREGRDLDVLRHLASMANACVEHINIGGVDDAQTRETVRDLPFSTLQGAYFSGPLTAAAMVAKYYAK